VKRLVLVLVALALALAGCKVDTTVTIDVEDDGGGVVTVDVRLDPEAVRATEAGGAELADRVRVADLANAGWQVGEWVRTPDGAATLELSKAFTSPDQVAGIVGEISGPNGPLRDVRAARDRGLLDTDYEVTGNIDLAAIQTGIGADPELIAALAGQQVDVNAIDASLLQQVRDSLSVEVVVNLPDATETIEGVPGQAVAIDASSSVRDDRRIVLILVAVALLVVAVVVFVGGSHSRRKARARAPIPRFDPHGRRPG
jgi:hypothetical protein